MIYQHILYGQWIGPERQEVQGVTVDIWDSMKPITVVTLTGSSKEECERVFNLFMENWRQWGYKVVTDQGHVIQE